MTVASTEVPAAPPLSAEPRTGRLSRLSDRLNPILVREVQQAIKGRVFPLTILVALAVSVVIATVVAADYLDGDGEGDGRRAFDAGFATLVPLIVFIVPMQAYNSMRTELRGGIVEQLLLTRLGPSQVLWGKLQAAMVQFVLYVSVLSPLLATSYLLRGVDLPTIGVSLVLAFVFCMTATAFTISSAAQAVAPALQGLANLGVAFGLGIGTVALLSAVGSGSYVRQIGWLRRSSAFWPVMSAIGVIACLTTTLSWLSARSFLLHAFENKSTGFRVFLFTLPPIAFGWMLLFLPSGLWALATVAFLFGLLIAGIVFGLFMVTEQAHMSPRVRSHAQRRGSWAAPLLPGRDRGMLCFAVYVLLLYAIGLTCWFTAGFGRGRDELHMGLMATAYGFVYLGIGRWIRHRLPDTTQANSVGRLLVPVVLFLFIVVPVLVDVLLPGRSRGWHVGHIMNPFWTIEHFYRMRWSDAAPVVIVMLIATVVMQVPTMLRGVAELRALRAQSRRSAAPGSEA